MTNRHRKSFARLLCETQSKYYHRLTDCWRSYKKSRNLVTYTFSCQ